MNPSPESASPSPVDESLIAQIARELHTNWLKARHAQGWKYGPAYDAQKLENPLFLPHEELPPEAREFNRQVTVNMLGALANSGYQISSTPSDHTPAAGETTRIYLATNFLKKHHSARLEKFLRHLPDGLWYFSLELYRVVCAGLSESGEPSFAFEVAAEGLARFKGDPHLIRAKALALAQTGAPFAALETLAPLEPDPASAAETAPVFARIYKDLWRLASDPTTRRAALEKSFSWYARASQANPDYYPAINAATTALFLGNDAAARQYAQLALDLAETAVRQIAHKPPDADSFWPLATIGEAALILGEADRAKNFYTRAGQLPAVGRGAIISARRQARLLLAHLGRDVNELEAAFRLPRVICFVGHMIDAPGRPTPRLPESACDRIQATIKTHLQKTNCLIGYTSAACGADILFAEALLDLGGELHVILPFARESFRRYSVDCGTLNWSTRFDQVLERAATVTYASHDEYAQSEISFDYCARFFLGLALMKSRLLETPLHGLAVWDGKTGDGFGGTATTVELWRQLGLPIEIIPTENFQNLAPAPQPAAGRTPSALAVPDRPVVQEIRALLFADVVGFSKFQDHEIPLFLQHYLAAVGQLLNQTTHRPEIKNTWGDGLYLVFDSVRKAGRFALELQAVMNGKNWLALGFAKNLKLRIGLHAGPVFFYRDDVIKLANCMGSHVNRAARIEPIAEEGQIYVSEPFAALAAVEGAREFVCDYVGEKMLAKKFGHSTLYLLRDTSFHL